MVQQMKFETEDLQDIGAVKATVIMDLSDDVIAEAVRRTEGKLRFVRSGDYIVTYHYTKEREDISDIGREFNVLVQNAAMQKIRAGEVKRDAFEAYCVRLTASDINWKQLSEKYAEWKREQQEKVEKEKRCEELAKIIRSELEKHQNVIERMTDYEVWFIDGTRIGFSKYALDLEGVLEKVKNLNEVEIFQRAMRNQDERIKEFKKYINELEEENDKLEEEIDTLKEIIRRWAKLPESISLSELEHAELLKYARKIVEEEREDDC